jgi:hypothetical protein
MSQQMTLNFEPGLAEKNKTLKAHVRERIYSSALPLKTVAAGMDLSETELSRKLSHNPNDTRDLTCDDLEAYIVDSGDVSPVYYLIEKYAISIEAKQAYAAAELAKALPIILALAKQAGVQADSGLRKK